MPNSLTIEQVLRGIRRDRNPVLASLAPNVLDYRGLGSGIPRALKAKPDLRFVEDQDGEEIVVTIPTTRSEAIRDHAAARSG